MVGIQTWTYIALFLCQYYNNDIYFTCIVRLVGGRNEREGRLEIYHLGEWGTVCDDWWDANDAAVVCRQLGYSGGAYITGAFYGSGSGSIWLDDVSCVGSEAALSDCDANVWGDNNCGHHEDAGVECGIYICPILISIYETLSFISIHYRYVH